MSHFLPQNIDPARFRKTPSILIVGMMLMLLTAFSGSTLNAMRVPFITVDNTTMRLDKLPEGTAGMMAEYVPDMRLVFLIGGYRTSGSSKVLSKNVWTYDPQLDSLSTLPDLPYGLALAGSEYVPAENKIYLFGGLEDSGGSPEVTSAVHAYNLNTGELETIVAKTNGNTEGTRNSAVYVPDQNKIYAFFGPEDETNPGAAQGTEVKSLNLVTNAYETVRNSPALDEFSMWGSAHLVSRSYPFIWQPEPADATEVTADNFILLLGSDGYSLFNPETEGFVDANFSNELYHPRGGSAAFIPGLQQVFMAGGKRNSGFCTTAVTYIDPRLPVENGGISTNAIGTIPSEVGTHSDAAAVYVSDLDRVLIFGGFSAPTDCNADWPLAPDTTYHDTIYSISPEYDGGWGESGLIIDNILNPVQGPGSESSPVKNVISVTKEEPPSGVTEQYIVAIQAAFLDDDGIPVQRMQTVDQRSFSYTSSNPQSQTFAIDIPENIAPSPTNMSGEQIVGICVINTSGSFQRIPNCREIKVTLDPGDLEGTILEDLSGIGQTGTPLLEDALVELIDVDGDVVAELTTGANGTYDFCPGSPCLAIGSYTLNVTKPYVDPGNPADRYLHIPMAMEVEVSAGTLTTKNIVLETTQVLGPEISKMAATHNGMYGEDIGTFLSFDHWVDDDDLPAIPTVENTFTIDMKRFLPDDLGSENDIYNISSVSVSLNGATQTATSIGNGQYQVTYNMSDVLTAGENPFIITAADSQTPPSTSTREYTVWAKPAKPTNAGIGVSPASYVNISQMVWNPITEIYTTRILVPSGLRWPDNPPHELDLELVTLYSQIRADIEIFEDYAIDGGRSAVGDGAILVQILSIDPNGFALEERFEVTPIYNQAGTDIESYLIESDEYDLCNLGLPKCDEWIIIKGFSKEIGFDAGIASFSAELKAALEAKYAATLRLDGTLRGDDYTLKQIRIIPQPEFSLQADGQASVTGTVGFGGLFREPDIIIGAITDFVTSGDISKTVGGGFTLGGTLYYAQPIVYEPDRSSPVYLDDPCVRFTATVSAWASMPDPIPNFKTDNYTIIDEQIGDACSGRLPELEDEPSESPDLMPDPMVAISPDRSNKIALWVEKGMSGEMPVHKIGYALTSNGAETSGTLNTGGTVMEPAIAFTSDTSAIAVWSQLDPNAIDLTSTTIEQIMATQEVYSAVWTESGGWESPVRLTTNSASDGRPSITADPATGKALVAWQRDSDANPETTLDLSIVTRHWNGSSWTAEQTVANDPTSQDSNPVVKYNTDGSEAWVIWSRDHDGNFNTNPDRRLAYSVWNGSSWSAAVEPSSWPTGAYAPDMVFSTASDKPLVTMIVLGDLGQDEAGNDLGQAGVGREGRLYAAWQGSSATTWDVQSIHDTRAESAQPILASPNRALILMRNFGGGGTDGAPSAGRMAIAAGEINPDGTRWVAPGLLTFGELPVWQVQGISVPLGDPSDADFGISFIGVEQDLEVENGRTVDLVRGVEAAVDTAEHVRATNLAGTNQAKILDFDTATNGVDLALESLEFSNLAPLPGEVVNITATVRSKTVRPMSWTDGGPQLRVQMRSLRDGLNENISLYSELHPVDLLFNESLTVNLSYRSTGDSGRILVQVTFPGDIDTGNNDFYQQMGEHSAPQNLDINELADMTTLLWDPPIRQTPTSWFYHIYRGPSEEGPWTFYDVSKSRSYFDLEPSSVDSYYAIEAYDQYKQRSSRVIGTATEAPEIPITTGEEQVSFISDEALVNETGGSVMLTVNLSDALLTPVTVDYATSNGTATAGTDFTNSSGTVTFNPGETKKLISVPITNDGNDEGNETFGVTLSNSIGALVGSKDIVTVTILDDDDGVPDAPSVSFSTGSIEVSEDIGVVEATVNLSKEWTQAVTVKIETQSGTATQGIDFIEQTETITFNPGETSKTIPIAIIDDQSREGSESFTVQMSNLDGGTLGSLASTTITIVDDGDTSQPPDAGDDIYLPIITR